MKKLLFLLSIWMLMFCVLLGNAACSGNADPSEDPPSYPYKNGIKILAIGNSFSRDGMQYLYDMLRQTGTVSNVFLTNAYIGGCDLYTHAQNAQNNNRNYTRQIFGPRGVIDESGGLFTLKELIEQNDWDIITLQQASPSSGKPATYNSDLDYLITYVKQNAKNPNVKLGWHMTWAYAATTSHANFPDYGSNQRNMYNQICNATITKIVPKTDIVFIIPAGTAIQNARLHFGDNLNNPGDGYHLNNLGCYIAAATWLKIITGRNVAELMIPYNASATAVPVTIDAGRLEKIVQSVNAAVATPFESPEH